MIERRDLSVVAKVIPIGLTLFPIGLLFGLLAAQVNWSAIDVLLMSIIGFTGSGQFAYLGFSSNGIDNSSIIVVFSLILGMNLRYIPMTLTASTPINVNFIGKVSLAHWLADESYALESKGDSVRDKGIIRIGILLFWCTSTVTGVLLESYLPQAVLNGLKDSTFPINAVLFSLGFINAKKFFTGFNHSRLWLALTIIFCCGISIFLFLLIGSVYFWPFSIVLVYIILSYYIGTEYDE